MQIDDGNLGVAIDLLVQGFPKKRHAFWEAGIARLKMLEAHAEHNEPIGYLMMSKGKAVGVGFTSVTENPRYAAVQSATPMVPAVVNGNLASADIAPEPIVATRTCINLGSWFILEEHRWKMPLLLREMMQNKGAVYTDLTPNVGVRPILKNLGFQPCNNGIKIIHTPVRSVEAGGDIEVANWGSGRGNRDVDNNHLEKLMADHQAMGCWGIKISHEGRDCAVLIKPTTIKFAKAAQVVFCTDNDLLNKAIGPLSRKMLRRGILALIVDVAANDTEASSLSQLVLPERRRRYVKNGSLKGQTDYAYSELVLFDL